MLLASNLESGKWASPPPLQPRPLWKADSAGIERNAQTNVVWKGNKHQTLLEAPEVLVVAGFLQNFESLRGRHRLRQ